MAGSILGTRVLRTEDPALLTGSARYLNDLDLPGKLHAVFVRSEVAHATLGAVHTEEALATPGVVAVFTAAELGVAPHHGFVVVHPDFARPPLADGVVRFVGEAIAIVVGETITAAADGAGRRVGRATSRCAAITDPEAAFDDDAPVDLPGPRLEPGAGRHRRRPGGPRGRQRRRRARPLRQPAHGRRADGAELLRGGAARRRADDVLRLDPDATRACSGQLAARDRHGAGRRCASSPRRSAAGSAARPGCAPSTPPSRRPPATSADR